MLNACAGSRQVGSSVSSSGARGDNRGLKSERPLDNLSDSPSPGRTSKGDAPPGDEPRASTRIRLKRGRSGGCKRNRKENEAGPKKEFCLQTLPQTERTNRRRFSPSTAGRAEPGSVVRLFDN